MDLLQGDQARDFQTANGHELGVGEREMLSADGADYTEFGRRDCLVADAKGGGEDGRGW